MVSGALVTGTRHQALHGDCCKPAVVHAVYDAEGPLVLILLCTKTLVFSGSTYCNVRKGRKWQQSACFSDHLQFFVVENRVTFSRHFAGSQHNIEPVLHVLYVPHVRVHVQRL